MYEQVFPNGTCPESSKNSIRDNNIAAHFMKSVLDQRRTGLRFGALMTALDCARLHPLDPHYYKALVYALAPSPVADWLRGRSRRVS